MYKSSWLGVQILTVSGEGSAFMSLQETSVAQALQLLH